VRESFQVRENVPLAPCTTLGVGGPARYFIEAAEESAVVAAIEFAHARSLPLLVLGGGSNLLVADEGYSGAVLKMALRGVRVEDEGAGLVTVSAGEDWDRFVAWCTDRGWAGIECLSGIPGTVGAAPVQNVGAYGQEVSETIVRVRALDRDSLRTADLGATACRFAYRSSIFNTDRRDAFVILAATFQLHPGGAPRLRYRDLQLRFADAGGRVTLAEARAAVLEVRKSKAMVLEPGAADCRSAGSFFKNPVVEDALAVRVEESARRVGLLGPSDFLPRYPHEAGRSKIAAAWLIEKAGFPRGFARGVVGLSSRHALAVVNLGGATAAEIVAFAAEIRGAVLDRFGISLEPEPVLAGFKPGAAEGLLARD